LRLAPPSWLITDIVAFFIAVILASAAAASIGTIWVVYDFGGSPDAILFFWFFVITLAVSILAGLLVGVPIDWALRRYDISRWSMYLLAGCIAGTLLVWILLSRPSDWANASAEFAVGTTLLGAIPGTISGVAFWTFARRMPKVDHEV